MQLRKAVVDHVSDSFLETNVPLEDLYQAAKAGDMPAVDMAAPNFEEHANKLVEVRIATLCKYIQIVYPSTADCAKCQHHRL